MYTNLIRIHCHAILCTLAALLVLLIVHPASAQIFYADFEDGSGVNNPAQWVPDNTGQTWGIANFPGTGKGLKNLNEGCGTSGNTPLPGVDNFKDGIIQLDMSWDDDDSWGVVFRKTADDAGYLVVFGYIETPSVIVADLAKGCAATGNCLDQVQCENNPANTLIAVPHGLGAGLTENLSVSYTGRIEAKGDTIRVWFLPTAGITDPLGDLGDPLVEIQDSAHTGPGSVGIWQESQGGSMIDNVIVLAGLGGQPFAWRPNPKDGAILENTWATISWSPGDFTVSHNVYLSDSFDDVNAGAEAAFVGNQSTTDLIIGFPGYPLPDGLVPGTTYYWRIDEVNDANAASPWKGDIWSFSIPPKTAYNPVPADRSRFIELEPTLSWAGGFGAKLHTVYFGDSFDGVSSAAGGSFVAKAEFNPPGPLAAGKVYYWRVDEFDPPFTHKGEVWSFEVAGDGGGVKGEYFGGMNFGNLVLTRADPQINFNWGSNAPDPLVGQDNFSVRWTGQVEAVFTETYTFYTNSDDGIRLWVDGKRLVNNWTDHGPTENRGSIDLVAGKKYSVVMEHYENGGGAVAELRWSSPRTPKQLIPAAGLSLLTKANTPSPPNGGVGAKLVGNLTWKPGDSAASHDVYFGADAQAVANATKTSPEYKGSKQLGAESFDPGKLAFNTDYFWRVDEVSAGSPVAGDVWSFNSGDFLLVDDFESYNDIEPPDAASNRIFDVWIDGFGTTTNGALAGNDLPPYAELNDVHGGEQAMPYRYDNANKTSEVTMTLIWPRDWTQEGVTKLSLWFKGASGNSAERMFVALGNSVVYHNDPAVTQKTRWTEWVIDLSAFSGVGLTNVNAVTIGFGTKGAPAAGGGTGTVLFDDIRLY